MNRTDDYDFELPPDRIAQVPADSRAQSRLLTVGPRLLDNRFDALVELLPPASVIVVNDTRVMQARLRGKKPSGGAVELLFVQPIAGESARWRCLANSSKPLRAGQHIAVEKDGEPTEWVVEIIERAADGSVVVEYDGDVHQLLANAGELPLPPYIERPSGPTTADQERYQTVFAAETGAVAAPTAGLHFTEQLLNNIVAAGHTVTTVTLHVGPGTFRPVRTDNIDDHVLDAERYFISEATADLIASGRHVVAVGTTTVRTLEAAAVSPHNVRPGHGVTDLFIKPGYRFQIVDHLVTNFHLPRSTLLMLVSAFGGYDRVMAAYRHAVASDYRFYSYGDAMLLTRADSAHMQSAGSP